MSPAVSQNHLDKMKSRKKKEKSENKSAGVGKSQPEGLIRWVALASVPEQGESFMLLQSSQTEIKLGQYKYASDTGPERNRVSGYNL